LENRRSEDDEASGRIWEAVEIKVRKTGVTKAERRRKEEEKIKKKEEISTRTILKKRFVLRKEKEEVRDFI